MNILLLDMLVDFTTIFGIRNISFTGFVLGIVFMCPFLCAFPFEGRHVMREGRKIKNKKKSMKTMVQPCSIWDAVFCAIFCFWKHTYLLGFYLYVIERKLLHLSSDSKIWLVFHWIIVFFYHNRSISFYLFLMNLSLLKPNGKDVLHNTVEKVLVKYCIKFFFIINVISWQENYRSEYAYILQSRNFIGFYFYLQ